MSVSLNDLTIVPINQTARVLREQLNADNAKVIFGDALFPMAAQESTYPLLVTLAVSEDCLRVVLLALFADDNLSEREAKFIQPFLNAVAGLFAKCRTDYRPFGSLSSSDSLKFLRKYRDDNMPFGFECKDTSWSGLGLCRRSVEVGGDATALENHANTLRNLAQAILKLDGVSAGEQKFMDRLEKHLRAVTANASEPTRGRESMKDKDLITPDFAELQDLVRKGASARTLVERRYDCSLAEWRRSAEAGDARGQVLYGLCYSFGLGVQAADEQASKWFRKAAEQGNAVGQLYLGKDCLYGQGVEEDAVQAVKWFRKAAKQGSAEGQLQVGICYLSGQGVEEDAEQAVKWFRMAAEQGNAYAQTFLGRCYLNGQGVDEDEAQAAEWFHKAAEQGDAGGQSFLGKSYLYGLGVDEDVEQAAKWFHLAAEQEDVESQFFLGVLYRAGVGVEQNFAGALDWFKKAADQGSASAQVQIGRFYLGGLAVEKDEGVAFAWFQKAAEQGNIEGQFRVATCYRYGWGVERSEATAIEWYRKAAEQGDVNSRQRLDRLESRHGSAQIPAESDGGSAAVDGNVPVQARRMEWADVSDVFGEWLPSGPSTAREASILTKTQWERAVEEGRVATVFFDATSRSYIAYDGVRNGNTICRIVFKRSPPEGVIFDNVDLNDIDQDFSQVERRQAAWTQSLLEAVDIGDLAAVNAALAEGANADYPEWKCGPNSTEPSVLRRAVHGGNREVVAAVLGAGARWDPKGNCNGGMDDGMDLWYEAVSLGRDEVANFLVEQGVDTDPTKALEKAIRKRDLSGVKRFIELNAKVSEKLNCGVIPWALAAGLGSFDVCATLESAGASQDLNSALILAACRSEFDAVAKLIAAGASVNITVRIAERDYSPMSAAVAADSRLESRVYGSDHRPSDDAVKATISALVAAGADPRATAPVGLPLLVIACGISGDGNYSSASLARVSGLLASGADPNVRYDRELSKAELHNEPFPVNLYGPAVFIALMLQGESSAVELLKHGADATAVSTGGESLLVATVATEVESELSTSPRLAKWAIACGADSDARTVKDMTVRERADKVLKKRRKETDGLGWELLESIREVLYDADAIKDWKGVLRTPAESLSDAMRQIACCVEWLDDPEAAVLFAEKAVTSGGVSANELASAIRDQCDAAGKTIAYQKVIDHFK